jgi:hypothetical protein
MTDYMTTAELAQATSIAPDLLLNMFDLGALRGRVRLVSGRPMFAPSAVDAVHRAIEVADQAAAGSLSAEEAWLQVLKAAAMQ